MDFSVELDGAEQCNETLDALTRRAETPQEAWGKVADLFYQHMKQVFATEGAANLSGPWAALDPEYLRWKLKHYNVAKILRRTGDLERIMTGRSEDSTERWQGNTLTLDFESETALYHQEGTRRMPARRLIDFPPELLDRMEVALMEGITHDQQ